MANYRLNLIVVYFSHLVLLVSGGVRASEMLLEPFPGSELVASSVEVTTRTHLLITGAIERVNTQLIPESVESLQGIKSSQTYFVPGQRRTQVVGGYFQAQLAKLGQIVYQCQGRTCGPSNHWANSIFNKAILYGPEQYQYYFLARQADSNIYFAVYVARRGTGKLYAHIDRIVVEAGEVLNSESIVTSIRQQGKYILNLDYDERILQAVYKAIDTTQSVEYMLVAHDSLKQGESVKGGIERCQKMAENFSNALVAMGIAANRVAPLGMGPASPLSRDRVRRFELVEVIR
ncbi:MAG: DUF4892 domain-containing protein [Pseudomonadales bacterium]|nr:DUF4892 domain-containing protein [Pseudomonadales bacterium]